MVSAVITGIGSATGHAMMTALNSTALLAVAGRDSVGETRKEDVVQASIIIGKLCSEVHDGGTSAAWLPSDCSIEYALP